MDVLNICTVSMAASTVIFLLKIKKKLTVTFCLISLPGVQEKLGILNNGIVYAVFDYEAHNSDELSFHEGEKMVVLRKGDEWEREWWWSRLNDQEGYIPRNLLGVSSCHRIFTISIDRQIHCKANLTQPNFLYKFMFLSVFFQLYPRVQPKKNSE